MTPSVTDITREAWLLILTYSPLGIIGLWRWGVWLIKKTYAVQYRPQSGNFSGTVAVVTPAYNEDPDVFTRALNSWRDNGVEEIVGVIDYTDTKCISIFKAFSKSFSGAKLVVTKKPGKRPALVDGIQVATTEFVALVDSDTIWDEHVKARALIPFSNPKIGGVATRQSVLQPKTLAQRLFNAQLNLRYLEEMPFMVARGGVVITCLSGRTAFYRRSAVLPLLDALLHETFWGKPVISGDDKRLTYLLEGAGWHTAFQQNAHVYTPGMASMKAFLKQRLRWTRNSWRADLRALTQPWVYAHPRFALYLIDRTLQPFAQLLSPIFFLVSLALGLWIPAGILFVWWHIGRAIRMLVFLRRSSRELPLVPVFVLFNFYFALMKVYALITMNRQGWITRWDKHRLPSAPALLRLASAYAQTSVIMLLLATGVAAHERAVQATFRSDVTPEIRLLPLANAPHLQLAEAQFNGGYTIDRYTVQRGDTIQGLSQRWGVPVAEIVRVNAVRLPSIDYFEAGLVLDQPSPHHTQVTADYESKYGALGPLRITYVPETNTIEVRGRGQQITPFDITQQVGRQYLRELSPGVWYLSANLTIKAGVTLQLLPPEVVWIKLKSDAQGAVAITAESGVIALNGVKVTSWDNEAGHVDEHYEDGRAYLVAKGNARLDIIDSELAYLGQAAVPEGPAGTSGVSWHLSDDERGTSIITGEVRGSRFHHNYDGAFVSGGVGMLFQQNQLYENSRYGLDLYGYTHDVLALENESYRNGRHGIILSTHSSDNDVRRNKVYDNGQHGIVVHQESYRNRVADNDVWGQRDGIVLHRAQGTLVNNNQVYANDRGLRLFESTRNVLANNELRNNVRYGLYLENTSGENIVRENRLTANDVGLYCASSNNEVALNAVVHNPIGVYLSETAQGNQFAHNNVIGNSTHNLYTKAVAANYIDQIP